MVEKMLRVKKETDRWVSYVHDVKIFTSTNNAMKQEALDAQRDINRKAIQAYQELRFPTRVLTSLDHSNVFVRSCIQGFCDHDCSNPDMVRFSFLKFGQFSNRISKAPICVWWYEWQHGTRRCMLPTHPVPLKTHMLKGSFMMQL